MKTLPTILLASLALIVPSTANAQYGSPAVGQTFCATASPTTCVTIQAGDHVRVAIDDANYTNYALDRYLFADIPTPTKLRPSFSAAFNVDKFGNIGVVLIPQPQDGLLESYCTAYTSMHAYTEPDYPAKNDTPASIYAACAFTRHESDPAPTPTTTSDPATQKPAAAPSKAQACAAVAVGKSKLAVTSQGVGCYSARGIIARYVKSGVEPEGFVCVTAVSGKAHAATCAAAGKASRRIVGKWRK